MDNKKYRYLDDGVDRARIRKMLKERGETQTRLAEIWGVSRGVVNNKLTGRSPFFVRDIDFFCAHFNLSNADMKAIFFSDWVD